MKCDICGEDIKKPEDLKKHIEQMHPADSGDKPAKDLETPDLLGDTPEESAEIDPPQPTS
ncbi:MAG: hypothetical protein ABI334_07770 [Candidatus Dormiibacterota bacterium]